MFIAYTVVKPVKSIVCVYLREHGSTKLEADTKRISNPSVFVPI